MTAMVMTIINYEPSILMIIDWHDGEDSDEGVDDKDDGGDDDPNEFGEIITQW